MGGQRRLRETTKTQQTRIRTGTKALWQNEHTQPSICFLLSCFLSLWPANATSGDLPLSTPVFTPFVSYRGVCAVDARVRQAAALVHLCVGLCLTHMACQKFSAKRYSLYIQAIAFLGRYVELRGRCQETFFNIGRALHQLGALIHAWCISPHYTSPHPTMG